MKILKAIALSPYFSLLDFFHYLHEIIAYYPNRQFRQTDLALIRRYLFKNPYRMSRRFYRSRRCPESPAKVQSIYGETYCMTYELMVHRLRIGEHDIIYELGCGRGRGCFFLQAMTNATVIGIDLNPAFIQTARAITEHVGIKGITFRLESIFDTDLSNATVIYFYGVAFSDQATLTLIEQWSQLPAGIRIVCVGFSLNDYYDQPLFDEVDRFDAYFLWGRTTLWVCETRGSEHPLRQHVIEALQQNYNDMTHPDASSP